MVRMGIQAERLVGWVLLSSSPTELGDCDEPHVVGHCPRGLMGQRGARAHGASQAKAWRCRTATSTRSQSSHLWGPSGCRACVTTRQGWQAPPPPAPGSAASSGRAGGCFRLVGDRAVITRSSEAGLKARGSGMQAGPLLHSLCHCNIVGCFLFLF